MITFALFTAAALPVAAVGGSTATLAVELHLRPEVAPGAAGRVTENLRGGPGEAVTLLRCPQTQLAWLFGPMAEDDRPLALRGTTRSDGGATPDGTPGRPAR